MPSATKYYHITHSSEGLKPVKEVKLKSPASVYRYPCLGFRPSSLWDRSLWWNLCFAVKSCAYLRMAHCNCELGAHSSKCAIQNYTTLALFLFGNMVACAHMALTHVRL